MLEDDYGSLIGITVCDRRRPVRFLGRAGMSTVAALVGALQIGVARADAPAAASVADALFNQARAEMRRGNFEAACPSSPRASASIRRTEPS